MANPRTYLAPWPPKTARTSEPQKSGPRRRKGGRLGRRGLLTRYRPQATAPFLHIGAVAGVTLLSWPVADTFYHIKQRGADSTPDTPARSFEAPASCRATPCACSLLFAPRTHPSPFSIACPSLPQVPRLCYSSYFLESSWPSSWYPYASLRPVSWNLETYPASPHWWDTEGRPW